jgi:hypothetical protein
MSQPTIRVELGLDLRNNPDAAVLDDAVRGILDNPDYTLAGVAFYDISDKVKSVDSSRGKSQALDRIDAGSLTVVADNSDRLFDPLYEESPFYGALVPRREIRVFANDRFVFYGYIDDFNLDYEPNGRSTVSMACSDALSVLNKAQIDELTPDVELSGARIETILSLPEVNWSPTARDIEPGVFEMLDATIEQETSALEYLQKVADSEFGTLFVAKNGDIVFRDRDYEPVSPPFIISDELSETGFVGVPFADIKIVYGSEYLYNRIVITNSDTVPEEAIAESLPSQNFYGVLTYSSNDLLTLNPEDLQVLADSLLKKYEQPVYRFESVTHILDTLSDLQQNQLLDVEIGDTLQIRFEPGDIPPAIEQFCRVIGISHSWDLGSKSLTYSLEKIEPQAWQLSDVIFGRLSSGNFLG